MALTLVYADPDKAKADDVFELLRGCGLGVQVHHGANGISQIFCREQDVDMADKIVLELRRTEWEKEE